MSCQSSRASPVAWLCLAFGKNSVTLHAETGSASSEQSSGSDAFDLFEKDSFRKVFSLSFFKKASFRKTHLAFSFGMNPVQAEFSRQFISNGNFPSKPFPSMELSERWFISFYGASLSLSNSWDSSPVIIRLEAFRRNSVTIVDEFLHISKLCPK